MAAQIGMNRTADTRHHLNWSDTKNWPRLSPGSLKGGTAPARIGPDDSTQINSCDQIVEEMVPLPRFVGG